MNKVLITGATGFIGRHFLKNLCSEGTPVRALVRHLDQAVSLPREIETMTGDLTQPKSLLGVCEGVETVFHLGGYAHSFADKNAAYAEKHYAVNYVGTKNLLQEAQRAHVKRFIYFSSVKAVGESETCIDEDFDAMPDTPYGLAKREAEKYVLEKGQESGMHVCILRPALVYGPLWKGNLHSMLRAIDKGIFLPLPETHNRRSMVSINDVYRAARLAASHAAAKGKIYFVTDGVYYSTRQLYVSMCEALGKRPPFWHVPFAFFKWLARLGNTASHLTRRRMPFNSDTLSKLFGSAQYDSRRIQQELGFKPEDDFKKMLPAIVAAYKIRS